MLSKTRALSILAFLMAFAVTPVKAEEIPTYTLTIKDHRFTPAELKVPAGKKIRLIVKNEDATAEEFESHDLHREKIIAGGAEASFTLRPLDKGSYTFFGEFNPETAQGKLIAE